MPANLMEKLGVSELTDVKRGLWKALLAEFVGTLLLNFFACGSCIRIVSKDSEPTDGQMAVIAFAFGLTVMAVIQAIGHISGGHVNPAVTAGMMASGAVSLVKGLLYIVAQSVGAIAGTAALKALTPGDYQKGLGTTGLGEDVTPVQGFGVEFFLGFILVFVVCGVCDPNKPTTQGIVPLVIGLTVTAGHLMALDYTGSSMNPARSLGSAVIANSWDNHWVYWIGPILGGIAAALLYKHAFTAPSMDNSNEYTPVQLKRLDKNKDEDGMA